MTTADLDALAEVWALTRPSSDGSNGDVAKREQAVHPSVWMFGQIGTLHSFPIQQFFAMLQSAPGMAGPNDTAILQSIDISGGAGGDQ